MSSKFELFLRKEQLILDRALKCYLKNINDVYNRQKGQGFSTSFTLSEISATKKLINDLYDEGFWPDKKQVK